MKFRLTAIALTLALASCSKMPIESIFRQLPERYVLTPVERQTVQTALDDFLKMDERVQSLELKAMESPTIVSVCGIANGNRLFVGDLHRGDQDLSFGVKHVVNIETTTTYELDVDRFCGR